MQWTGVPLKRMLQSEPTKILEYVPLSFSYFFYNMYIIATKVEYVFLECPLSIDFKRLVLFLPAVDGRAPQADAAERGHKDSRAERPAAGACGGAGGGHRSCRGGAYLYKYNINSVIIHCSSSRIIIVAVPVLF